MALLHIVSIDYTNEIAAPVEEVFALFKDIARWPEWVSVLSAAAPLSDGPLRAGFRLQMYSEGLLAIAAWILRRKIYAYDRQWSEDFKSRFERPA